MIIKGQRSEVRGKVGGSVELDCKFCPSEPDSGSSSSPYVVEWIRQGLDVPVLMKFGSHAPRVHPNYEGEYLSLIQV